MLCGSLACGHTQGPALCEVPTTYAEVGLGAGGGCLAVWEGFQIWDLPRSIAGRYKKWSLWCLCHSGLFSDSAKAAESSLLAGLVGKVHFSGGLVECTCRHYHLIKAKLQLPLGSFSFHRSMVYLLCLILCCETLKWANADVWHLQDLLVLCLPRSKSVSLLTNGACRRGKEPVCSTSESCQGIICLGRLTTWGEVYCK